MMLAFRLIEVEARDVHGVFKVLRDDVVVEKRMVWRMILSPLILLALVVAKGKRGSYS